MFSCPRRNETVNDMGAKLAMREFSLIETRGAVWRSHERAGRLSG